MIAAAAKSGDCPVPLGVPRPSMQSRLKRGFIVEGWRLHHALTRGLAPVFFHSTGTRHKQDQREINAVGEFPVAVCLNFEGFPDLLTPYRPTGIPHIIVVWL